MVEKIDTAKHIKTAIQSVNQVQLSKPKYRQAKASTMSSC